MTELRVVGFDPSMDHWGAVKGTLLISDNRTEFRPEEIAVMHKTVQKHKTVRQNSTDLQVSTDLAYRVQEFLGDVRIVFAEMPVGSQNAAAMKGYGICLGLLGAIQANGTTLFQLMPKAVKKAVTGRETATKAEMIEWATGLYPTLPWPTHRGKLVAGSAEHIADAIATVHAGINDQTFKALLAMRDTL